MVWLLGNLHNSAPQNAKYLNAYGSGMPSAPQHGLKRGQHELQKKATAQAVPAAPDSTVSTKITCHHITTREANCPWKSLPAQKNQKSCSNLKPRISCVACTSGGQKKERNDQQMGEVGWRGGVGGEVGVYLPLNSFLPPQKIQGE